MSYKELTEIADGNTSINDYLLGENVFDDLCTSLRIIAKYRPKKDGDTRHIAINWDNHVQIQQDIVALAALNSKIGAQVGVIKSTMESTESFVKMRKAQEAMSIRRAYETGTRKGKWTDSSIKDEVLIILHAEVDGFYNKMAKYETIANTYRSFNDMINALKLQLRVLEDDKKNS